MTDDKKHEDKDRKKVSDEELEDVAGGTGNIEIRHGDSKKKLDKEDSDGGTYKDRGKSSPKIAE